MPTKVKRESREFWAVHEGIVLKVVGYSCAPSNPDYWWCPSIQYSMAYKKHLFDTQDEALKVAIREIEESMKWDQKQLAQLKKSIAAFQQ